jgi:hypothetical protein
LQERSLEVREGGVLALRHSIRVAPRSMHGV